MELLILLGLVLVSTLFFADEPNTVIDDNDGEGIDDTGSAPEVDIIDDIADDSPGLLDHEAKPAKPEGGGEPAPADAQGAADDPFSPDLISIATELGISEQDARAYGSPELLSRALEHTIGALQRAGVGRQAPAQQLPQQQQAAPEPFKPFELNLPEDFAPEITGEMKRLVEFVNGPAQQVQELRQALVATIQQVQQREQARTLESVDATFAGFGDEFSDLFGTGGLNSFPEGSREHANRTAVIRIADGLLKNAQQQNERLSVDEALRIAAHAKFHDRIRAGARQDVQKQAEQRRKAALGRTDTSQPSEPENGELALRRRLGEKYG